MNSAVLNSFRNELVKIAGLMETLRLLSPEGQRSRRRVDYLFSDKAGTEKWKNLPRNAASKEFVRQVLSRKEADPKLKMHVRYLHELANGRTVAKVESQGGGGKTYEIRELPGNTYGCTCNDWRYVGTVTPGYECKHIRAHKEGKTKVGGLAEQSSEFFFRLSKKQQDEAKDREEYKRKRNSRPFSNLLTQEEEPRELSPSYQPEEPEFIIRM